MTSLTPSGLLTRNRNNSISSCVQNKSQGLILKELCHDILSYFGQVQKYLWIEKNLKISVS